MALNGFKRYWIVCYDLLIPGWIVCYGRPFDGLLLDCLLSEQQQALVLS